VNLYRFRLFAQSFTGVSEPRVRQQRLLLPRSVYFRSEAASPPLSAGGRAWAWAGLARRHGRASGCGYRSGPATGGPGRPCGATGHPCDYARETLADEPPVSSGLDGTPAGCRCHVIHWRDAGATGDWTLPARLSVDRIKMKIRMKIGTRNGGDARFGGHVAGDPAGSEV
jgi:hypothetical protein